MQRDPQGYYTLFGVTPDATPEEINQNYNRCIEGINLINIGSKEFHDLVTLIETAYITLSNTKRRKLYDRQWQSFDPVTYLRAKQAC